jgi:hypothetical protein
MGEILIPASVLEKLIGKVGTYTPRKDGRGRKPKSKQPAEASK